MESLSKIKIPIDPYYSLRASSFFKNLVKNDCIILETPQIKESKLSKETVSQNLLGFFQYVSHKNEYSDIDFMNFIHEIHFRYKSSKQKEKNYISLLIKSLEEWSLESGEIEFMKNLLIKEKKKTPKFFSFYMKTRQAILNHCKLIHEKKIFFLDEVDLFFSDYPAILKKIFDNQNRVCPIVKFITEESLKNSMKDNKISSMKFMQLCLDEFQDYRFSRSNFEGNLNEMDNRRSNKKINRENTDESEISISRFERKATSIECKKIKEIKKKDQSVFWEMLEILIENYKDLWKQYKESIDFILSILKIKDLKDKYQKELKKFHDSLEGFELKYNINGFLNKIDNILMSKYKIDRISQDSRAFLPDNNEMRTNNSNKNKFKQSKSMFYEESDSKINVPLGSSVVIPKNDSIYERHTNQSKSADPNKNRIFNPKSMIDIQISEEKEEF